jgi:hypothetical protein
MFQLREISQMERKMWRVSRMRKPSDNGRGYFLAPDHTPLTFCRPVRNLPLPHPPNRMKLHSSVTPAALLLLQHPKVHFPTAQGSLGHSSSLSSCSHLRRYIFQQVMEYCRPWYVSTSGDQSDGAGDVSVS